MEWVESATPVQSCRELVIPVRIAVQRPRLRRAVTAGKLWILLGLYLALTACILVRSSPVLTLDQHIAGLHLGRGHRVARLWVSRYVVLGQRGPATLALLPFFVWTAWRERSTRPLVLLGLGVALLNLLVGVSKLAIGRLGPWHLPDHAVHDIFAGGDIYPSGHVSNAVVLYGLVAWVVAPRFRTAAISAAVFVSITVGLGTIYLRTHWFSDVLGGWLAGGLLLVSLPTLLSRVQPRTDRLAKQLTMRCRTRARRGQPRQRTGTDGAGNAHPSPRASRSQ